MNNETKNVQERNELHKTIWDIANDLRGHVDGWEFKNYVLGFLFYRYISEYIAKYINDREHEQGSTNDFDYTKIEDSQITQEIIEEVARTKGFFIKPSELFINVAKNAYMDEENLNIKLSNAFKTFRILPLTGLLKITSKVCLVILMLIQNLWVQLLEIVIKS